VIISLLLITSKKYSVSRAQRLSTSHKRPVVATFIKSSFSVLPEATGKYNRR
jgi:hypothetical protein